MHLKSDMVYIGRDARDSIFNQDNSLVFISLDTDINTIESKKILAEEIMGRTNGDAHITFCEKEKCVFVNGQKFSIVEIAEIISSRPYRGQFFKGAINE